MTKPLPSQTKLRTLLDSLKQPKHEARQSYMTIPDPRNTLETQGPET